MQSYALNVHVSGEVSGRTRTTNSTGNGIEKNDDEVCMRCGVNGFQCKGFMKTMSRNRKLVSLGLHCQTKLVSIIQSYGETESVSKNNALECLLSVGNNIIRPKMTIGKLHSLLCTHTHTHTH